MSRTSSAEQSGPHRSAARALAERIRVELEQSPRELLPTVSELSRQYGVARSTVGGAVDLLRRQGIICSPKGHRLRTVPSPPPPPSVCVWEQLYERLRRQINDGELRPGDALPKYSYLISALHCSTRTITRAYAALAEHGMAHLVGKRWIVGRAPASYDLGAGRTRGVVLVLGESTGSWGALSTERTAAFAGEFLREISLAGVQIQHCFADQGPLVAARMPAGIRTVTRQIVALGDRYLGTLLLMSESRGEMIAEWVSELCRFGRPVVWLDRNGTGLSPSDPPSSYYRCSFSEQAAVASALQALADAGHRSIAVPILYPFSSWRRRRCTLLAEAAPGVNGDLRVWALPPPSFRQTGDTNVLAQRIDAVRHFLTEPVPAGLSNLRLSEALGAELRRLTTPEQPSAVGGDIPPFALVPMEADRDALALIVATKVLSSIIEREAPTAIAATCDRDARIIHAWLDLCGIRVPEDMSIISFDNYPATAPFPISTMDFGFGSLGYSAAHLLMGDVHIDMTPDRVVFAKPFLDDRGSIGRPRRRPLRIPFARFGAQAC